MASMTVPLAVARVPSAPQPARPSAPSALRAISVVVPAYREAANFPELIERLEQVRLSAGLDLELIIVNDESGDDTPAAVSQHARSWVRLVTRNNQRGLATAVLHGVRVAQHPTIVVMDADLSHPPEAIPALLTALHSADFAVGSRYVPGGSTDDRWTLGRALNSRIATCLARPFTRIRDPLSGFFALRRATFDAADPLSPLGYKIGLELLVKCRCRTIAEVPIHFASRARGRSKLTLAEQVRYLRHLCRLFLYRLQRGRP